MPARFVNIDRATPLLLPPDMRQWIPEDHLVHFILDAVDSLTLTGRRINAAADRPAYEAKVAPRAPPAQKINTTSLTRKVGP